jgi:hypothetical protein
MAHDPQQGRVWAPEVVKLRFRYFDGSRWRNSWDSLKQKGLPMAVEVRLSLRSLEDVETWYAHLAEHGASAADTSFRSEEGADPMGDLGALDAELGSLGLDDPSANPGGASSLVDGGATGAAQDAELREILRKPTTDVRLVVNLPGSPLKKPSRQRQRERRPQLRRPTLPQLEIAPAPVARPVRPAGTTEERPVQRRSAPREDAWIRN